MLEIEKELLLARLHYLNEIDRKPSGEGIDPEVSKKIRQLVDEGEISDYLALESVYSFLKEKAETGDQQVDKNAAEIISFLN